MNAEAIVTVSALVVALVQLAKWARMSEEYGPAAVLGFSLLGVAAQVFGGDNWPPDRLDTIPILAGWVAVATSAAGVFGFTRAAVGAITRATPPPSGAGSEPPAGYAADLWAGSYTPERPFILHDAPRCVQPGLMTTVSPREDGALLNPEHVRHLDGRRFAATDTIRCDACGSEITYVVAVGGGWLAKSAPTPDPGLPSKPPRFLDGAEHPPSRDPVTGTPPLPPEGRG